MNDRFAPRRATAERHFRAGGMTPAEIAACVGLSERTIKHWSRKYRWDEPVQPPQTNESGGASKLAPPPDPAAAPDPAPDPALDAQPISRADIIRRFYAAVDRNLQLQEQVMQDDTKPTVATTERSARALGTSIRNLVKVTELESGTERDANSTAQRRRGKLLDAEEDAHRIRLELAERILRIRAQRRAERASGRGDND